MTSISQQNKIVFEIAGGTNHAKRAQNDDERLKIRDVEMQVPLISQPICEKCERIGYWDKKENIFVFGQWTHLCYCDHCGAITTNPLTYGEYLAFGYDIPSHMGSKEREESIKARKLLNAAFNVEGKDGRDDEIFK